MRSWIAILAIGCGSGAEAVAPADATTRPDASADSLIVATDGETADGEPPAEDTAPADVAPSCMNGTRDGEETDVDCGGTLCPKCVVGRTCASATDCRSNSCGSDGVCACTTLDDCPTSTICVGRVCHAALANCAATKATHPSAPDGEYWIKPLSGTPYRAYCDMVLGKEICSENGGSVSGKTREGAGLTWYASTKLDHKTGLCTIWALRGSTYPFDDLKSVAGQTMKTCAAFGFKADATIGACPYGTAAGRGKCGFTVTTLNRYGNACTTCTTNPGNFHDYTLQGPISSGSVLSNVSGTIVTTCRVR